MKNAASLTHCLEKQWPCCRDTCITGQGLPLCTTDMTICHWHWNQWKQRGGCQGNWESERQPDPLSASFSLSLSLSLSYSLFLILPVFTLINASTHVHTRFVVMTVASPFPARACIAHARHVHLSGCKWIGLFWSILWSLAWFLDTVFSLQPWKEREGERIEGIIKARLWQALIWLGDGGCWGLVPSSQSNLKPVQTSNRGQNQMGKCACVLKNGGWFRLISLIVGSFCFSHLP